MANPPAGASEISASSLSGPDQHSIAAMSFTNVDQTSPVGFASASSVNTSNGNSTASCAFTASNTYSLLVSAIASDELLETIGAGGVYGFSSSYNGDTTHWGGFWSASVNTASWFSFSRFEPYWAMGAIQVNGM